MEDKSDFLRGGGEMGSLMRSLDWTATSLGPPSEWPQPLRTVVRLMLNTQHPIYIWWGSDGACLYNDAYRQSIGPELHPSSLGRAARIVWEEIWHIVGPQIEHVMSGRGATWNVDHLVPITRYGVREEVYWTYSYSPIDDADAQGGIGGVLVICTETTQQVLRASRADAERKRLAGYFEQSPMFMAMLKGPQHQFEIVNPSYLKLIGNRELIGKHVADALPEAVQQGYVDLLDNVYRTGKAYVANCAKYSRQTIPDGPLEDVYIDFIAQPTVDDRGSITGIFIEGADVTDRRNADEALRESGVRLALLDEIAQSTRKATDPRSIMQTTTRLLANSLQVTRCAYADVDADNDSFTIRDDWAAQGYSTTAGTYSLALFGQRAVGELYGGRPLVIRNVDLELQADDGADMFNSISIKGLICFPLIKDDGLRGMMAVHSALPRDWTPNEIALVQEVAERSWAHIERVRSEALQRANDLRLSSLIDTMPSLIWTANRIGQVQWVSKWLQKFTGRSAEKFTIDLWPQFIHPDDVTHVLGTWKQSVDSSMPFRMMCRVLHKDGDWRWLLILADPVYGESDVAESWCGSGMEIHEFKLANDALDLLEPRLRGLLATIPGFIWTADSKGEIDYISPRFIAFTGRQEQEFKMAHWKEFIHPDDVAITKSLWVRANLNRKTFRTTSRIRRHDGAWRWVDFQAEPELDQNGQIKRWFGYSADNHEPKETADNLAASEIRFRELADELSRSNQRKDEFLATLAHELRNPLAPIRNGLELMRLATGDEETIESARTMMTRQVAQMVRLIDDLLDLSRVSRGMVELRRANVDIVTAVLDAVETSQPIFKQHGNELSVDVPDEKMYVEADSTRLVQIFANLLNNAAKFTPSGGAIKLKLYRSGSERCTVAVSDNGRGIPPAMLEHIFDMFTQVNRTHTEVGGGLGIGLTLVRKLVEMHGGSILALSEGEGMGSEFRVSLPLAPAAVSKPVNLLRDFEEGARTSNKRVLIADDNVDAAQSLSSMLTILGHETRVAYDGEEAFAIAETFQPDAMVLDIAMPRLNGHDLARRIRTESWGAEILLIAASGWAHNEKKLHSREAGFDAHLVKPIDLQMLRSLLR